MHKNMCKNLGSGVPASWPTHKNFCGVVMGHCAKFNSSSYNGLRIFMGWPRGRHLVWKHVGHWPLETFLWAWCVTILYMVALLQCHSWLNH